MKILSWNVNGIRSYIIDKNTAKHKTKRILTKDSVLFEIITKYDPDVICFQETRLGQDNFENFMTESIKSFYPFQYWSASKGTGSRSGNRYSGTSIWCKKEPDEIITDIPGLNDTEGRVIQINYPNIIIINTYTPNAGSNLEYRLRTWEPCIKNHLKKIGKLGYPVVYCGDNNVANKKDVWFGDALENAWAKEIDFDKKKELMKKIKSKKKLHTGETFTPSYSLQERTAFFELLYETNFIDCFRHLKPDVFNEFTWFSIRDKKAFSSNRGWLIDRFLVQSKFSERIRNCKILRKIGIRDKEGHFISDHLPILLDINTNRKIIDL